MRSEFYPLSRRLLDRLFCFLPLFLVLYYCVHPVCNMFVIFSFRMLGFVLVSTKSHCKPYNNVISCYTIVLLFCHLTR
jgi:hypothetical protein